MGLKFMGVKCTKIYIQLVFKLQSKTKAMRLFLELSRFRKFRTNFLKIVYVFLNKLQMNLKN